MIHPPEFSGIQGILSQCDELGEENSHEARVLT
jgi:hypothetical protein